ncbi:Uncharacterised protein [Chlamydia trachomatis]|nr:Uncharacterised protein [Chlamydia trachomatis]
MSSTVLPSFKTRSIGISSRECPKTLLPLVLMFCSLTFADPEIELLTSVNGTISL